MLLLPWTDPCFLQGKAKSHIMIATTSSLFLCTYTIMVKRVRSGVSIILIACQLKWGVIARVGLNKQYLETKWRGTKFLFAGFSILFVILCLTYIYFFFCFFFTPLITWCDLKPCLNWVYICNICKHMSSKTWEGLLWTDDSDIIKCLGTILNHNNLLIDFYAFARWCGLL